MTWSGYSVDEQGITESPVYEMDIDRDLNLLIFVETWD